jgi:5-methylcytosine-specific restriction endonuclease McrA
MSRDDRTVVRIEDRTDRWRFVCPNGHRSWEPTNHHFWCQKCARDPELEGTFEELHDKKTDDLLERDEVLLLTPVGPYDRDLAEGGSA